MPARGRRDKPKTNALNSMGGMACLGKAGGMRPLWAWAAASCTA
jgi:hypothetical protein